MRDLAPRLIEWLDDGHRFAVATVVRTSGSAPRQTGSSMAVREDGLIVGSVSGGCVEGAVVDASLRCLKSGRPEMLEFGAQSDAVLWEVGLSCGGSIRVWVEPADDAWRGWLDTLAKGEGAVRAVSLNPELPGWAYSSGDAEGGDEALLPLARRGSEITGCEVLPIEGRDVFLVSEPVQERMIVVGAVHIAIPLVRFARELGLEPIVVEPRSAFAKAERFGADPPRLVAKWPDKALEELGVDARTHVVTLAHDPKLDDPALIAALRGGAAYVGALGGSKTQEKRRASLREAGLSDDEIGRIHAPVGLDIGARTPEEIALSIVAQLVERRRAGALS